MLKKLVLASFIALSFGGAALSFATPAAAAIDSYMFFQDYDSP